MPWHRIDSPDNPPPKDGTAIILCCSLGIVGESRFFEEENGWWWAGFDPSDYQEGKVDDPAFWQPLPDPPKEPE